MLKLYQDIPIYGKTTMSLFSIIVYDYWEVDEERRIKRLWLYNPQRRGYKTKCGYPLLFDHTKKKARLLSKWEDTPIYDDLRFPDQPKHDELRNETKVTLDEFIESRSNEQKKSKLYLTINGLCPQLTDDERYRYQEMLDLCNLDFDLFI